MAEGTALVERTDATPPAVVDEKPGSLLQAIVAMAENPAVDVTKLDAILQMQEKLERRQAEKEFTAAFARLSAKLPRVKKSGTIELGEDKAGKKRGSIAFARWEDMDKIIRPLLIDEGFALSFDSTQRAGDGGGIVVTATLMHSAGHSRTASMALALDAGPGRNNLQAMGSSLSYGKRYTTEMLLNIVREGEDDDGVAAGMKFVTTEQAAELDKAMREKGIDPDRILRYFEIADVRNLKADNFAPAMNMVMAMKAKA